MVSMDPESILVTLGARLSNKAGDTCRGSGHSSIPAVVPVTLGKVQELSGIRLFFCLSKKKLVGHEKQLILTIPRDNFNSNAF